jgi:hypothetical protein
MLDTWARLIFFSDLDVMSTSRARDWNKTHDLDGPGWLLRRTPSSEMNIRILSWLRQPVLNERRVVVYQELSDCMCGAFS